MTKRRSTGCLCPSFAISKYPITNAQYQVFVDDGGYTEKWQRCWTTAGWQWRAENETDRSTTDMAAAFDLPNHPVVGVSWYEAVAFCNWLSEKLSERARPCRDRASAQRGGMGEGGARDGWAQVSVGARTSRRNTRTIPLLESARPAPWASSRGARVPTVCSTRPATCGSGRAACIKSLPLQADDGREDLEAGGTRTLRGGSWYYDDDVVRCAYRGGNYPDCRYSDVAVSGL